MLKLIWGSSGNRRYSIRSRIRSLPSRSVTGCVTGTSSLRSSRRYAWSIGPSVIRHLRRPDTAPRTTITLNQDAMQLRAFEQRLLEIAKEESIEAGKKGQALRTRLAALIIAARLVRSRIAASSSCCSWVERELPVELSGVRSDLTPMLPDQPKGKLLLFCCGIETR